jgi:hypothetical protein
MAKVPSSWSVPRIQTGPIWHAAEPGEGLRGLFKALFRREASAHDDCPAFRIGIYREGMRHNH